MRPGPFNETVTQSPVSPHSTRQSPINKDSPSSRPMTSTVTLLPSSPLDLSHFNSPRCGTINSTHRPSLSLNTAPRPKLSLNTSCSQQRTLGKGNTGLRLDTLSASSPTVRNTYKNSYEPPTAGHTPLHPIDTRSQRSMKPPTPHPLNPSSPISAAAFSTSSSSSVLSSPDETKVPYTLGKHPRSILSNGPVGKRNRSREKRKSVGFHERLEEEVINETYTAAHYDLLGTEEAIGVKRESPEDEGSDEEEQEGLLKTPVAGRKKRRREWVWTLGSSEEGKGEGPRLGVER